MAATSEFPEEFEISEAERSKLVAAACERFDYGELLAEQKELVASRLAKIKSLQMGSAIVENRSRQNERHVIDALQSFILTGPR